MTDNPDFPDFEFPTAESRGWALVVLGALDPVFDRESFLYGGC